jgi:hypothetical protein
MKPALVFGVYCLMILLGFSVANYRGWAVFGNPGLAASSGGTRAGGSSGFHK